MKIENYKTYISEIPLHKKIILTKNDKIAMMTIEDIPHILIRTRRELELKRTILKTRVKISIEKDEEINNIMKHLINNNIETLLELLEEENLIIIHLCKDQAKILIGKIVSRNSGTDIWNLSKKGKIVNIENIKRILHPLNIKITLY